MTQTPYNDYNWPKRVQFIYNLPALAQTDLPFYFTGNDTNGIVTDPGRFYRLKKILINGEYSAAGTGVSLAVTCYKGAVGAGNEGIQATTVAEDNPNPVTRASNIPLNTATRMDTIDDVDGLIGEISLAAGDTFTLVKGAMVIVEVEFQ